MNNGNQIWAHAAVFIAALLFLAVIIVTGHDSSPLLTTLLTGVAGGAGGASIGSALGAFFKGPNDPTGVAPLTSRQGGYVRLVCLPIICVCALVACAGLNSVTSTTDNATAITEGCATASATIKSLTVIQQAGKLSAADVQGVNEALAIVTPICEAPAAPDATQASLTAITAAAAQLTALQLKYHATP